MIKKIASALFLCLLTAIPASATTYYISQSGSDSNNGQSWSQAWSTVARVNSAMRPGDTAFFGTGTWYNSQLVPPSGGDADHITLYACSSFVAGITHIYGGQRVTGWTQYSGSVYRAPYTPINHPSTFNNGLKTYLVVQNDSMFYRQSSLGDVNGPGKFYQSSDNDSLYAWVYGGDDPDNYAMHASVSSVVRLDMGQDYIHLWGLDLRYSNHWVINFGENHGSYCVIERCNVAFAAHADGNNTGCIGFMAASSDAQSGRYDTIRACTIGYTLCVPDHDSHNSGIIQYANQHLVVESCYVGPRLGYGIHYKGATFGNAWGQVYRYNTVTGCSGAGIYIFGGYSDSTYGNVIKDCGAGVVHGFYSTDPTHGGGPHYVLNNTFYNCRIDYKAGEAAGSSDSALYFKYNVAYQTSSSNYQIVLEYDNRDVYYGDENIYYGSQRFQHAWNNVNSLSSWQSLSSVYAGHFDPKSVYQDPGFADPGKGDFSRPNAPLEMNVTYGGRTWTKYGAVQDGSSTALQMSNPLVDFFNDKMARVTWFTNKPATSQVLYGETETLGQATDPDNNYVTTHSASITGLEPSTTYYFRVVSRDAQDNQALSGTVQFTTAEENTDPGDTTDPILSGVTATNITPVSALITWTTNEPATSQIFYGIHPAFDTATATDANLVANHSVKLDSLAPNTLYYYKAVSIDAAGNTGESATLTFTTPPLGSGTGESAAAPTYAYPNPFVIGQTDYVTFSGVPAGHMLVIVTASGTEIVKEIPNDSGGEIYWDGRNESGYTVANGVYLWFVKDTDRSGKLVIEK